MQAKKKAAIELPDEILEAIVRQTVDQDPRSGCILASTCKRLWTLQLPSSVHMDVKPGHKEATMLFQRIAWTLQRAKATRQLHIHISIDDTPYRWRPGFAPPNPPPELQAVINASRDLANLNILKWDVWLTEALHPRRRPNPEYVQQSQLWLECLLLGAPNITALSLGPNIMRPPVLGTFPLRHLELLVDVHGLWLQEFLEKDLRHITTLESLAVGYLACCRPLKAAQLESMKSLRHVRLHHWLPTGPFSLPKNCRPRIKMYGGRGCEWEKHSQEILPYITVVEINMKHLRAWPSGIQRFSMLQCLTIEKRFCGDDSSHGLDVADLQRIPHVKLIFHSDVKDLKLTAGSCQSLDIRGVEKLAITDIDAFLKGTENFAFEFCGEECEAALAVIRNACHNNGVHSHEFCLPSRYTAISTAENIIQANIKHADMTCDCSKGFSYFQYCNTKGIACLWPEDTFWPKDPCTPAG